ncbi:MAG: Tat pathway signal protein [Alcanivorax sp.]|nr:Tat pathway signal protein [Alcanivorax sp.]MAY10249.1 Tat pathway signal protein [Alcanivorax sp.]MBI53789.1 Tat pathway signal protein [Alcanivorax sp.]MBU59139.1 Tat pathway signal protein [Alcanivorax sp.]HCE41819.1 Tat pathway signal protein [Alcanivorax sp.]|tara:strand:+ start:49187 stop:49756 length:570 start_codon:yes stop_codon:yes gene_type:complete
MNRDSSSPRDGVSRRGFLKLGFWGATALTLGAGGATLLTGCSGDPGPASGYQHLRERDLELLRPLMAPLLAGGLDAVAGAGPDDALKAFDRLLAGGSEGARGQLFQLLDLLQLGAARWWVTGTWAHFADQDEAQLQRTLAEWSDSDNGFAQLAFKGLTQPLMMAWYVTPDAGLGTGYPGPPLNLAARPE